MATDEPAPPWQRRALGLACTLVVAKACLVALRVLDGGGAGLATPLAPIAMLWEDAWLVAIVTPLDAWLSHRSRVAEAAAWAAYAIACAVTAANVPVARVMSTPLTASMLRATGGALSDSIGAYVTATQLGAAALVAAVAVVAPRMHTASWSQRRVLGAGVAAVALGLAGPRVAPRVDSLGLHRNALLTLARSTLARHVGAGAGGGGGAEVPALGAARDLGGMAGAARGRHVVWVVLESTGARYLAPWGAPPPDPMPTLTALSRDALRFPSAYAVIPESIKGFFSEICAVAPAPDTPTELHAEARSPCHSLPEVLRGAGYATGLFHSGRFVYLAMNDVVKGRGFDVALDAEAIGGKFSSSFGTDDASTVARTLSWLDEHRGRPTFAMVLPIAGHHPYRAPGDARRPFPEEPERSAYANDLFVADQALEALVDGLRARGLWSSTLLVVSGDHGQAFFQHEGNLGHTMFIYEENVHVPLLFVAPGLAGLRGDAPQLASVVDVAPTIVALLGLAAPPRWQGASLLEGRPRVARFFTDAAGLVLGLRNGPWKLVHEVETGRARLFDLDHDPGETTPIHDPAREKLYLRDVRAWAEQRRAAIRR